MRRSRLGLLSTVFPPPLPWGYIGRATRTSNVGPFSAVTDLTDLSLTWTAVTGRRVRIRAWALFTGTSAGDDATLFITDGSNVVQQQAVTCVVNTTNGFAVLAEAFVAPASGSVTYKARAQRTFGAGNLTMVGTSAQPGWITAEDLGPA